MNTVNVGIIGLGFMGRMHYDTYDKVPGALVVERNHLEWRLDPASEARIPQAVDHDVEIVVSCQEGYASSLAVKSLQDLGLHNVVDLDGGFLGWRDAGLPTRPPGA